MTFLFDKIDSEAWFIDVKGSLSAPPITSGLLRIAHIEK